jgi:hypothetical protein
MLNVLSAHPKSFLLGEAVPKVLKLGQVYLVEHVFCMV